MSWVIIGGFSIAVAFILMQLFKYFVTAPELAAVEASKRKNNPTTKKSQATQKKQPKEKATTDSTPKETSSKEVVPKEESKKNKQAQPQQPSVSFSAESPKETKPAKENKQVKANNNKAQKDAKSSSNENKASSSSNEAVEVAQPAAPAVAAKKGKQAERKAEKKAEKKRKNEWAAVEVTDEEFSRQWAADYQPSSSSKETPIPVSTPEPWKQVGNSDGQMDEYKRKIKELETELISSREANKNNHEKYLDNLAKTTKTHNTAEQALQATITRLNRELDALREGGALSNDSLRNKDYTSQKEKVARPAQSLSSLIADEKQKGKVEKKEQELKDKEDRERSQKERDEKDKLREKEDKESAQANDKQTAVFKQIIADLEAKQRETAEQLKATETVNNFLTATLASEAKSQTKPVSAPAPDRSAEFTKKIDELTQQLTKSKQEAEEKIKALSAQLKDRENESKGAEETHTQALAEANAQIEKLRGQLTALEASSAKGSGNEEAIKQLQQSLNEEKEKTDAANQLAELAEAAKLSYKSKFEDAQKASEDLQTKIDALKKDLEESSKGDQRTKTIESELAAVKSARSEEELKHAQALEAEVKRATELQDALTTAKEALATAIKEKDAAAKEALASAANEKDAAAKERDAAAKEALATAAKETEAAAKERDAAAKERDAALKERDAAVQEKEAITKEKEAITKEKDQLNMKVNILNSTLQAATQKLRDAQAQGSDSASSTSQLVADAKAQVAEAVQRAEEANKKTEEATVRADEAAKNLKELSDEVEKLKKRDGESETKVKEAEAKVSEEKAAREDVVRRLEEVSARVKELEAQPQAGGSAGLKLMINSPNVIAAEADQQ